MESKRIKEPYNGLASPKKIEKRISSDPVRIALPFEGSKIWRQIIGESVYREQTFVKGAGEEALVYFFETKKEPYKEATVEDIVSSPTIDYRVFESHKERLIIWNKPESESFEIGPYVFSSWDNTEDELLKNERDTKISNIEKFAKFGNTEFLDLIKYINPATKLNPKDKGKF